jgi:3-oxoacyl-[acyl-carrier-protein] synthase II
VGSAALALQDAGLHYSSDNPQTRAGVSFGTALGGVANAEIQHKAFVTRRQLGLTKDDFLYLLRGSEILPSICGQD